jgi:hypothetical protein
MIGAAVALSTGKTGNAVDGAGLVSAGAVLPTPRTLHGPKGARPVNHDPVTIPADALPCHVFDPDLWWSDYREDVEEARGHCSRCPIVAACLAGAIERKERAGVWGGVRFTGRGATDTTPALTRKSPSAGRALGRADERDRLRRARAGRDASDVDPARVAAALAALRADRPADEGLTRAEIRAVVRTVYPGELLRKRVAELLGCSESTVARDAGTLPSRAGKAA